MKQSFIFFCLLLFGFTVNSQILWLDEIQVPLIETGWGISKSKHSVDGNALKVGGKAYSRGVGTHAVSKVMFDLKGSATGFSAIVGVDDESGEKASVEFCVLGDKKVLWQSGVMKKGDPARKVDVSLKGINKLALLVTDGGDGINYDHADWLEAFIEYKEIRPIVVIPKSQKAYNITPPVSDLPKINYPRITGGRPGMPFLFTIPATGKKPLQFTIENLPAGLTLDENTGIITGITPAAGIYLLTVTVANGLGKDQAVLKIKSGETLALTPPMGWNSWNSWGLSVDEAKVKKAADVISEKLMGHGWTYVNIDDGWEAPKRDGQGNILANEKFPDMKALGDYVHRKGLKMGIYSSPGEKTCGGFLGSYKREIQDVKTWESWGVDYLKYDWCSYDKIAADHSLPELKKPYLLMRDALRYVKRDIVYSLCQYGMGNVWEWGESVSGNLWRTTGDITDSWNSMAGIGFSQDKLSAFARPGSWNDPDMLVVGKVGWGPRLQQTRLTPDEQYTHISLWSLLSAPLLIGCDLDQLDDFTLNLLTNDEVIAVNQDPKGSQAVRISRPGDDEVWKKEMDDGSVVVGIFYTKPEAAGLASEFNWETDIKPKRISVSWAQLGITGTLTARDLWRQKDIGQVYEKIEAEVNWHGCALIKLTPGS
ncbi:MAG: NPCBM/NEW2 domain-containing protein [Bacteroidales bacterium]